MLGETERRFLAAARTAVLATRAPDGHARLVAPDEAFALARPRREDQHHPAAAAGIGKDEVGARGDHPGLTPAYDLGRGDDPWINGERDRLPRLGEVVEHRDLVGRGRVAACGEKREAEGDRGEAANRPNGGSMHRPRMHHHGMEADTVLSPIERGFLAAARTAVLATRAPDGHSRLVPICFVVTRDPATGGPILHTPLDEKPKSVADPRDLERVRDILERPAVDLLVDRWSEDWSRLGWLRLQGLATLLEPPGTEHGEAFTALRSKYPQYATHRLEGRPIIRIAIVAARSWGDLAPD